MDESLDQKPTKVVARKGARKVHCCTSGNKSQITVLVCANANENGCTLNAYLLMTTNCMCAGHVTIPLPRKKY